MTAMCYITHDCEVNFVDVSECGSGGKQKTKSEKLLHNGNPHLNCVFIDDNKLIACGYDKVPFLYTKSGAEWTKGKVLDDGVDKQRKAKISGNSFLDKKVYFNSDFKLDNSVQLTETDTKHANYINCLKVFAADGNKALVVSTSDINGYLNFWDVTKL